MHIVQYAPALFSTYYPIGANNSAKPQLIIRCTQRRWGSKSDPFLFSIERSSKNTIALPARACPQYVVRRTGLCLCDVTRSRARAHRSTLTFCIFLYRRAGAGGLHSTPACVCVCAVGQCSGEVSLWKASTHNTPVTQNDKASEKERRSGPPQPRRTKWASVGCVHWRCVLAETSAHAHTYTSGHTCAQVDKNLLQLHRQKK